MKMMPGRVAQIEWEDDDQRRIADLIVFDRTDSQKPSAEFRHAKYGASHGACIGDWMTGERARSTPAGLFATMVRDGFSDQDTLLAVLDQFGQIEEADWARTMADGLRELLIQEAGGDEEAAARYPMPEYRK